MSDSLFKYDGIQDPPGHRDVLLSGLYSEIGISVLAESDPALFGRPLPIAGSAGDQQAALVGHGALKAGDAKITYGTAAFLVGGKVIRRRVGERNEALSRVRRMAEDLEAKVVERTEELRRAHVQLHPSLLRRATTFLHVASGACSGDVFPRRAPSQTARNHMIEGQVLAGRAVLTAEGVAQEQVEAGEGRRSVLRHVVL